MTKIYSIYRLTSPSGKTYIGYTGQPVMERIRQHVGRAKRGGKFIICEAIRKYGIENFTIETLSTWGTEEEAWAEEVVQIAAHPNGYNISLGGAGDLDAGRLAFIEKLKDPVWKAQYSEKLSIAIKGSELFTKSFIKFPDRSKKWREENPELALELAMRGLASAREANLGRPSPRKGTKRTPEECEKMSIGSRAYWDNASPEVHAAKSISAKRGATKQWAQRTPEQRAELSCKISESLKRRNANLNEEELAKRDAMLAETRKNIDHDVRKANQKIGLQEYWTEEKRAEKSVWGKEYQAKLKAEREELEDV